MLFKTARRKWVNPPLLKIDNINIDRVHGFNFLGLTFNEQLNWKSYIETLSNWCSKTLSILNRRKQLLPLSIKIMLNNSLILLHLNYVIKAWGYKCDRMKNAKESRPNYKYKQI